jgi:hypothetical protein
LTCWVAEWQACNVARGKIYIRLKALSILKSSNSSHWENGGYWLLNHYTAMEMQSPVGAKTILDYVQDFLKDSRSIGVLLFSCTLLSLFVANSPVSNTYI